MAERHDLIITISETGEVTVKAEGIDGPKCVEETGFLTDENEVVSQEYTSEYYKQDEQDVEIEQNN